MTKRPIGSQLDLSLAFKGWMAFALGAAKRLGLRTRVTALALLMAPLLALGFVPSTHSGSSTRKEPIAAAKSAVAALRGPSALRPGALATGELQLVGLQLTLPTEKIELPDGNPFFVRPIFMAGGRSAGMDEVARTYGTNLSYTGTFSGPGVGTVEVSGTPETGLSMPAMKGEGDYILSGVKLWKDGRPILDATPTTKTIRCLGQVLISSVSSTPMTLQEIKDAGIQLGQENYEGRRFTMALSIGSRQVTLTVPVAVPVYNGVRTVGDTPTIGRMELKSLGGEYPGDISVVAANLAPPPESFNIGRPSVEHVLQHAFKAFLVIPGSIGYLHQYYKADVVVFNALGESSPYRVSHLKATFKVPPGKDGAPGTPDDPLRLAIRDGETDAITKSLLGNDNLGRPGKGVDSITGGQSAMATYYVEGLKEGSHPLDFRIEGQFEGGDLQSPVPIQGTASGKLLVRNPTFSLVLVHPDVVRRGEIYTMEARLTNTSGTLANDVSITIDKARLGNVKLAEGQNPTQRVDTLLPGESTSFKFQFKALKNGEVRGSYAVLGSIRVSFQLGLSRIHGASSFQRAAHGPGGSGVCVPLERIWIQGLACGRAFLSWTLFPGHSRRSTSPCQGA